MKTRILVALIGAPLLVWVLIGLPPLATMLLLMALCGIGAYELMRAVAGIVGQAAAGIAIAVAVFIPVVVGMETGVLGAPSLGTAQWYAIPALVTLLMLFGKLIYNHGKESQITLSVVTAALFAGFGIPLMLTTLLRLRMLEYGQALVLVPLVAAFGSDTMAYFMGLAFGKHKLAPLVSPKKTIEGSLGGFLGGILFMLVFRFVAGRLVGLVMGIPTAIFLGLLGSLMGQFGDLAFSVIKREFAIKDFGNLLPGHGGVLDRFDSVIFVAPMMWLLLTTRFAL